MMTFLLKFLVHPGFLLGFLGRGGKCRVGAEEPLAWPPEHFEISDAQRSHFMPSELNHVWVKYLVVNGIYSNTLCTKPLHVWSIRKT